MKKLLIILFALVAIMGTACAASLSVSINSLEAISEGDTVTLTATVTASGDSVSNVSLQLGALPAGTATSDSLTQSVGTLSSGQSSSKSWTIRGDVAGNYTFNVTASGTSVSDTFQNASLVVNTAAFIEASNKTCSATTAAVGDTVTMNFIVKNTGGSSATVTINMIGYSSNFTLSSGSASSSFALSAGSQSSKSYVFTAATAGTAAITAAITSTKNNPASQTCTVTVTGGGGTGGSSSDGIGGNSGGGGSADKNQSGSGNDKNVSDGNVSQPKNCSQLGGNICRKGFYCNTALVAAKDTVRCCTGKCAENTAAQGGQSDSNAGQQGGNQPKSNAEQPLGNEIIIAAVIILIIIAAGAYYYFYSTKKKHGLKK